MTPLPTVLVFRAVILLAPVVAAAVMAAAWLTRRLIREARERVRRRQLAVRAALPLAIEVNLVVTLPLAIEPATGADGVSP